ncbi:MAG: FAD-binding protein [Acidobacteria bacterium]|nr:FAD-binding protein [Acidobacteriota bacterium]
MSAPAPHHRAARPERWHNWAGDQVCQPTRIARPSTVAEIVALVQQAAATGQRIKAVGAGHSFTDIALTEGIQLSLDALTGLQSVNRATGEATFAAGTRLYDIPALLAPYGLAMTNLGDINVQSLAGAISTGTHGTGLRFGGIATQVTALTLVDGAGTVEHVSATENPELFSAARVGLGALGIITSITLACVPAFRLHAVERPEGLNSVLDGLTQRMASVDHFEFYWFPHTEVALTKTNTRSEASPWEHKRVDAGSRPLHPARRFLDDTLMSNTVFSALCSVTARIPQSIPRVNSIASKLTGNRAFADASHRVFATERRVRFREMEYAVPLESLPRALADLKAMIERKGYNISFPVEVRCAAADDIELSTASGRLTGYIAIHQFRATEHTDYFHSAEQIFLRFGGRPHWGKWHYLDAESLQPLYPEFEKFCILRQVADPQGIFGNAYLDRVLLPLPSVR